MKTHIIIQRTFVYAVISASVLFLVFVLGFMTEFHVLFVDGNSAMYDYYKDLQNLNHQLFTAAVIAVVASLFLLGFDINKQVAGVLGLVFTLILTVINIINGVALRGRTGEFAEAYRRFDFSILEDYSASLRPFHLIYILFGIVILLSVTLFIVTAANHLSGRKEAVES